MWKEQIGKNKSSYVSSARTDTSGIVTRGSSAIKKGRRDMRGFNSVDKEN